MALACTPPEGGVLDTAYTSSTSTSGESEDTDESTDESETESETGPDEPQGEPLRYVVAASQDSVVLALVLDDPHDIPPAEIVASGDGLAGLFGLTPFGTEALTHDGKIQQLRLTAERELELSPLVTQDGNWLTGLWFGDEGANALVSPSADPLSGSHTLLWVRYDQSGKIISSADITPYDPPIGFVSILARSPNSRWALAAVDAQPNGSWDLHLIPIDPSPGAATHVGSADLGGVPPISISGFLSVHLDDQRLVFRHEQLPEIYRPVAVNLDNPSGRVDLGPNLPHIYSISAARGDASRLLVTTGGVGGYRQLRYIELDGPTSAQPPLVITEPDKPALENGQSALGVTSHGHGIDVHGRAWYVYRNNALPQLGSIGIALVTVVDGAVAERLELAGLPPAAEVEEVFFDPEHQLLGFRIASGNLSSINYVDLSEEQPTTIRVDPDFEHSASTPGDHARYGWSADGSRLAIVGVQQGQTVLHVAEIGDVAGATVKIELPEVERTLGYTLDHRPHLSQNGEQLMLWYGTPAGLAGLIHAPTNGSAGGRVVLAPQYALSSAAFLVEGP